MYIFCSLYTLSVAYIREWIFPVIFLSSKLRVPFAFRGLGRRICCRAFRVKFLGNGKWFLNSPECSTGSGKSWFCPFSTAPNFPFPFNVILLLSQPHPQIISKQSQVCIRQTRRSLFNSGLFKSFLGKANPLTSILIQSNSRGVLWNSLLLHRKLIIPSNAFRLINKHCGNANFNSK